MPHESNLRDRLGQRLGPEAYNRLVWSIPDIRCRGRLRFWHEQLLSQAGPDGVAISNAEDFLRIFDGATVLPVPTDPLTREVFLHEIEKWPFGHFRSGETPAEWMTAAWEIDYVREALTWDMTRTVSKTGELAYREDYLEFLSRALPVARQVELFLHIHKECFTREVEFRPGFERAFPASGPFLPPPLTHEQMRDALGMTEEEYQQFLVSPNQPTPVVDDLDGDVEEQIPY